MKRIVTLTLLALLTLGLLLPLCACGNVGGNTGSQTEQPGSPPSGEYTARIEMTDGGIIDLELYPDVAPQSVYNFISLARQGKYDGCKFHRIVPGFVIQGGDFENGNGTGGPGYSIKGEFAENGVENNLKHTRGMLSMARSGDPDSAGSQFFICVADCRLSLDGKYAAFGKVTSGMDVVDEIVGQRRKVDANGDYTDFPVHDIIIKSVTVNAPDDVPAPNKLAGK